MVVATGDERSMLTSAKITFGLVNGVGLYLTAEKFGNQISVSGSSLRSKQMWTFVAVDGSRGYLRSPQQRYLETDKNGGVVCDSDEVNDDFSFDVLIEDGKWMFKDRFGKFLSSRQKELLTLPREQAGSAAFWVVHFAHHPQCNMLSVTRKRYVRCSGDEFAADEDIPWGQDAVVTLEFQPKQGLYALRDSKGRFLNGVEGRLDEKCTESSLFVISIHGKNFGFRCSGNKKYLTVHGKNGKLVAGKASVGKDEQFALEESKAQCVLVASNNKKVSIRQGKDVTANIFDDAEDTETFQIGYEQGKDKQLITLQSNKLEFLNASEKSVSAKQQLTDTSFYKMEWIEDKVALLASNGRYITSSSGGKLTPSSSDVTADALFTLQLVNRPIVALRGEYGYMATSTSTNKVQCNRGLHEIMHVESKEGRYSMQTGQGRNWRVVERVLVAGDDPGDLFLFVLHSKGKMAIKAPNGMFLKGDNNGNITATEDEIKTSTLWEY